MYSRYTFVYRVRAGEAGLRKHQVAWTTQRQIRCTRGLHSAGLRKADKSVSNNEDRRRGSGMVVAVVVKSIQRRCEIGNSPAPKIPPAQNRMNHQKGFPSDPPLLSACAAIAILSHRGIISQSSTYFLNPANDQGCLPCSALMLSLFSFPTVTVLFQALRTSVLDNCNSF